ncbi:hypothetical protein JOM56_012822 [Amanita muscaria]
MPPCSPIAPVGSPFRFPYTHVHRQAHSANDSNANANANAHSAGGGREGGAGAGGAPTPKVSANNTLNNANFLHWGAMSDSTFSPAPTFFQECSSPSHEHFPLPSWWRETDDDGWWKTWKPPPRVESTQPRDFSSEPSSSILHHGQVIKLKKLVRRICWISSLIRRMRGLRRRRSESWEDLALAFQNLDRQTGTTTILVASLVH